MTRLIDADALDSVVLRMNTKENAQITRGEYKLIDSVIFEFPTVDAVPVRHGKWAFNPGDAFEAMFAKPKCSECGFESADGWNYCPNCGARMDKDA